MGTGRSLDRPAYERSALGDWKMADWRAGGTASIVGWRCDVAIAWQRTTRRGLAEGGIMTSDAWNNGNDMSTSSEQRRRTEAALVRAIDMYPDVSAATTRSAICAYVDLLVSDGLLPEAVVIAF